MAENQKGASVGSKLQCSGVTITSHLSLAMCGVRVSPELLHSCTPPAANPGPVPGMPHLGNIYPSLCI